MPESKRTTTGTSTAIAKYMIPKSEEIRRSQEARTPAIYLIPTFKTEIIIENSTGKKARSLISNKTDPDIPSTNYKVNKSKKNTPLFSIYN